MPSSKQPPAGTGFIYRLVDPRNNTIHYIGQTTSPLEKRLKEHLANPTNPAMRMWFELLKVERLKPRPEEIQTVPVSDLDVAERAEIDQHMGEHPLLNDRQWLRNFSTILSFSAPVSATKPQAAASGHTMVSPLAAVAVKPSPRERYRQYFDDLSVRRREAREAAQAMEAKYRDEIHRLNATAFGNQRTYDQAVSAVEAIAQAAHEQWGRFHLLGRTRRRLKRMARRPGWWRSLRRRVRHAIRSMTPPPRLLEPSIPVLERDHQHNQRDDLGVHYPATYVQTVVNPYDRDHVIMLWETCVGLVGVVYVSGDRHPGHADKWAMQWLQEDGRDPAAVVLPPRSMYPTPNGKYASAVDAGSPTSSYTISLDRIYKLFHRELPWWPPDMRTQESLVAWRPDQPVEVGCAVDRREAAIRRTMAALSASSPVQSTLEWISWRHDQILNKAVADELGTVNRQDTHQYLIPAIKHNWKQTQVPRPDVEVEEAAWREILARTDEDAVECLSAAWGLHGGDRLHLGTMKSFKAPVTGVVAEWVERLEPVAEPTAAHKYLVSEHYRESPDVFRCEYLTDPVTGIPAACEYKYKSSQPESYETWAPKQLETTALLSELILDETVWVRTKDGTLYIAPQPTETRSCTWGYAGSGPANLANLVIYLLKDISARPDKDLVRYMDNMPEALEEFTSRRWPNGTVITRPELETVVLNDPLSET